VLRLGIVFKAHRLLDHSTLGSRVIKKKKKGWVLRGSASSLMLSRQETSDPEGYEPSARSPSWGHPRVIIGAVGLFLEPFCGH
jgi:hypothetical protein